MKKIFLAILVAIQVNAFAQVPDSSWLISYTIETQPVQLLRAPADKITLRTKNDIMSIQKQLDKCKSDYEAGKQTYKSSLESEIEYVGVQTPEWPVAYYTKELQAYLEYNKVWNTRDIERVHMKADQQQDSLRIVKQADGYCFVNVEKTIMNEKPWGRGMVIATFTKGSYLRLIENYSGDDTSTYIHVAAFSMDGYVRKSDMVNKLYKLTADSALMKKVKTARYFDYTKSAAYVAKEQKVMAAAAAADAAAEAREAVAEAREAKAQRAKYHWGPKGGCYFINSNGKKEYVSDKSLCR